MIFEIKDPIVVDTETYYSPNCSVKANKKNGWVGGNYHYTMHPEFYAYMLSWVNPYTGECGVIDDPEAMKRFIWDIRHRTFVAHNAGFDIAVAKRLVPEFEPFNSFDTADLAAYLQCGRSLADASKYLLGTPVDKAMREFMSGKHYRDLPEDQRRAMREYALVDAKRESELFIRYKDQWPDLEKWLSNHTRKQNWAGIHIDANYLEQQVDKATHLRSAAVAKIPWVENVDEDKPMSAKKLAMYCREEGILPPASLAEDSEECQAWERQYGDSFPVVGAIRDFRKSNTYVKKLDLIQALLRPDGTIPFATKYFAAVHTGRFSATQFNYQSLPRDSGICDLRGCLVPAPGHKFIGSDLSGVEARVLLWLAGDYDYLSQVSHLDKQAEAAGLSGGGDIYEPAARRLFGYSDPRPLKSTDKNLRNVTKVCVLQLGYQSGAKKFNWFLGNNVQKTVLDRVRLNNESDEQLATRLVQLYRAANPKVVGLWRSLDSELRQAQVCDNPFVVQQPIGRMVKYMDLGVAAVIKDGVVRNEVVGRVCMGDERVKLYGGKITENLSQEMGRHLFVNTIYNLHQAGFPTRMSVHDENVVEVPEEHATRESARQIERIMSITPSWAPGLPLAAETQIMNRYAK